MDVRERNKSSSTKPSSDDPLSRGRLSTAVLQASAGLVASAAFLPLVAFGGWVAKRNAAAAAATTKNKGDNTPPGKEVAVSSGPPQKEAGATTSSSDHTDDSSSTGSGGELPGRPEEEANPCHPESSDKQDTTTTATPAIIATTPSPTTATTTTTEFHDDFVIVKYIEPGSTRQDTRAEAGARAKHGGEEGVPTIAPKIKRRAGADKVVGKAKANTLFGSRFRERVGDALDRSVRGLEDQLWATTSATEERGCADEAKVSLEEVETCLLQVETQVGARDAFFLCSSCFNCTSSYFRLPEFRNKTIVFPI